MKKWMMVAILPIVIIMVIAVICIYKRVAAPAASQRSTSTISPPNSAADDLFNRGLTLIEKGNWREGKRLMEKVISSPTASVELKVRACQEMARYCGERPPGYQGKGQEYARMAIDLQGQDPDEVSEQSRSESYLVFGMVALALNQPDAVIKAANEAMKVAPDNFRGLYYLAKAQIMKGEADKAIKTLNELKRRIQKGEIGNPKYYFPPEDDFLEISILTARAYILKKQPGLVKQHLYEAWERLESLSSLANRPPSSVELHQQSYNQLGWAFLEIGELEEAKKLFNKAVELGYKCDPGSPQQGLREIERLSR